MSDKAVSIQSSMTNMIVSMSVGAKLLGMFMLCCSIFMQRVLTGLLVQTVFMLGLLVLSVQASRIRFLFKPCLAIMLVAFVTHAINISFTGIMLSKAGMLLGCVSALRIFLMVGYAGFLVETISATDAYKSFSHALNPLEKLNFPVQDMALVIMVALRFMPVCAQEFSRIHLAHKARGVMFDQGSLGIRLTRWISVFVPLLVSLFRRSNELALALDERGFTTGKRVLEHREIQGKDVAFVIVCCGIALLSALV